MFLVCHNLWATEILAYARSKYVGRSDTNPSVRLYRHTLPDGRIFIEFVQGQANVKSGLLIFVAFKDKDDKKSRSPNPSESFDESRQEMKVIEYRFQNNRSNAE